MAALSYMQRRSSGTYEFRRRLPEALAGKQAPAHMRDTFGELINPKTGCFKREVVRSLKTTNFREAKRRDHQEALRATQLFEDALSAVVVGSVSKHLSELSPKELGDEVYAELLARDEAEREGDDRRHLQSEEDREQWPDLANMGSSGMGRDHFFAYGELLSDLEGEYREALARRDPTIVAAETSAALKQRGVYLERSSPKFPPYAMAVLEAHVRAYEAKGQRQQGRIVLTPIPNVDRGPRLSEAFEAWKAGGTAKGAKKPNANTIIEAEQAVRCFRELHGDMHLCDISREKARQFRDAIAAVPRNLSAKLRKLPLLELLKADLSGFPPRSITTVNKIITLMRAIVSHAEREGSMDRVHGFKNPFDSAIRFSTRDLETGRAPFSKGDLKAIFESQVYMGDSRPIGGGKEAAFWFPLIALLSGMRLEEIAQLRICDLQQDEETGRWFFDVSRSGGRTTKTISSIRLVPVHKELVRIGLLRYRQLLLKDATANERQSLWPDVKAESRDRQLSSAWSKWFGRYLREKCGVTDDKKVFHSFRHTFKRLTRDALIHEELHDALTGHSGNGNVGRSYGKGYSMKPLVAAIDKVAVPIDLKDIVWNKAPRD